MPRDEAKANEYKERRQRRIDEAKEKAKNAGINQKTGKNPKKGKSGNTKGTKVGAPDGGFDHSTFGNSDRDEEPLIVCIFGDGGVGKTTVLGAFPGDKVAIGFDNKTEVIAKKFRAVYPDERFDVFNGVRYYPLNLEDDKLNGAAHQSVEYVIDLIVNTIKKGEYKWGILDATDVLVKMAEHAMRHEEGFGPFNPMGKDNYAAWGIRNRILRRIINRLVGVVEYGVIIIAYYSSDTSVSTKEKAPSWPTIFKKLSRAEVHAWKDVERDTGWIQIDHTAEIFSSKDEDFLRTGDVFDMHTPDLRNHLSEFLGFETTDEWLTFEEADSEEAEE